MRNLVNVYMLFDRQQFPLPPPEKNPVCNPEHDIDSSYRIAIAAIS